MAEEQTFTLEIHEEDGSFWAEVVELPGCFSSGETLDELQEAAVEAILMYLDDNGVPPGPMPAPVTDLSERRFLKSPPMPESQAGFKSARIAVFA